MVCGLLKNTTQKLQTTGALLIVDDCSDDAVLARYALTKLKVLNPVRTVTTGEEMVAYVEGVGLYADRTEFPYPSLVLLDLKLPQMKGRDAQMWLRSISAHRKIPIFVMSNDMCVDLLEEAVQCGADGYLIKSVTQDNLRALCERQRVRLQYGLRH